ncbi:IS30 family transposase [Streptococcus pneumoniae]|uniref:IS30 family transposase n=4 Tax=Streptococcus pneumoniae TaxID=1313 RepID=UPI0001D8D9D2|nr:IS30 family transposase [Streptococcus pneumoniae]EHD71288.1 integrase core domain protein [Streptococcus pneumoniae GA18523]EHD94457.1 integrase core domain protein [Streptococcus pneumoniae GA14798]EHE15479.1 integrase core domain protein [Streptococcus pneumoniae GA19451]EHE42371.1 integrase core domain protein [Streptococcus pneumoniae GA47778]EHE58342.1 integrase core domain protein [Streptococcus pneumoniae 5185-06]EHZ14994.1 integrase core domain protein [Streptococcus pneumoniae GA
MQDNYTTKGKHLTIDSRRLIERWKKEGKSNREIASLLGKAPQTIHTEIKRGTVRQCLGKGRFKEVYSADYAQQSYENNRKRSVKKSSLTKELKEKILHYHNQKFSPDKKQASTNFKPAGQSIEQRSEAINLRLENGHYEIDTVLLTRAKNYCLLVLTDRKSRHQIIRLIPNKSAEVVNQALKLILKQHKILSITADNGTEFNRLFDVFSEEHIYYAHPYASWERGTNENHNRLIRRWLPKGTKKMTPKEVAFIEKWINNYPKKCLDYKSPREDFWMANLNLKFSKMEIIFIKRFQ